LIDHLHLPLSEFHRHKGEVRGKIDHNPAASCITAQCCKDSGLWEAIFGVGRDVPFLSTLPIFTVTVAIDFHGRAEKPGSAGWDGSRRIA
jgi:hypothetical protein